MTTTHPIEELRRWAKVLDEYVERKTAEAKAQGKAFPIFDYKEHGVPPEIEAEIERLRSPEHMAARRAIVRDLDSKANDAGRFAALHREKIAALTKEIETLMAAAEKHKAKRGKKPTTEWMAEAVRLGKEIDKATRAKASAERGAEKQEAEQQKYLNEAVAAQSAIGKEI